MRTSARRSCWYSLSTTFFPCFLRIVSHAFAKIPAYRPTWSASGASDGCTFVSLSCVMTPFSRLWAYSVRTPRCASGLLSALWTSLSESPRSFMPERASRRRRISFVPSKIMLIRLSRSARPYGYSFMKPLPPAICRPSLMFCQRTSVPNTLHRPLERVVADALVHEAGRQVDHRLQGVRGRRHPRDLVADHLEVGDAGLEPVS